MALGSTFEREIREQPDVWDGVAASDRALRLARAFDGDVVYLGSGSSLFAAQLGAMALRRRGIRAHALAATEARLDNGAYRNAVVVAISQSGRSSDLLEALAALSPRRLVALTNSADSPLAQRADVVIDIGAGSELAVPASKSVTATVAILLWAASIAGADGRRTAAMLATTAAALRTWLAGPETARIEAAGVALADKRNVVVLGSAYGQPIAAEVALKFKEASYLHAEGFAAGEFRHGSIAMVDASYAALAIVDPVSFSVVALPMRELAARGALQFAIGEPRIEAIPRLGPVVDEPFNTLAWLVTAQLLTLYAGRSRGIDGDAPRGLTKALVGPEP